MTPTNRTPAATPALEISDHELRLMWRAAGGKFHGPNIETGTMPESVLLPFLRSLAATPLVQEAEPVAWRPNIACTPAQNFNAGRPRQQDVDYWDASGCGIEYAYSAPPARSPLTDEAIEHEYRSSDLQPQLYGKFDMFEAGVRFAERSHGIVSPQPPEGK